MEIERKRDIFTVSRLNLEVRSALEGSFPLLWISGEISNLAIPRSGHIYFSLKDNTAQVRAAMFRNRRSNLGFKPEDGMQVIVRAKVTLYEPRGDYQLIIEHMEQAGEGLLRQQVEELRQKLAAEGLFEESSKKPLPEFPARVGVVTSATGAAVRDVLTVLNRRCPSIPVVIYPVPVQGATAATQISEMLEIVHERHECDLLILTRGGGSLEDLMPFNDEKLVRTLHALPIPVISAVGHEIDTTLCDFAADRRAPTPSAAAELASPDCVELSRRIEQLGARTATITDAILRRKNQRCDELMIRLTQQHPGKRLSEKKRRLILFEQRMQRITEQRLNLLNIRLSNLAERAAKQHPGRRLSESSGKALELERRLKRGINLILQKKGQQFSYAVRQLHTLSPLATLERGYAIALDEENHVIGSIFQAQAGDKINVRLADGSLQCEVNSSSRNSSEDSS